MVAGDLNQCGQDLVFMLCRYAAVFRALVVFFSGSYLNLFV